MNGPGDEYAALRAYIHRAATQGHLVYTMPDHFPPANMQSVANTNASSSYSKGIAGGGKSSIQSAKKDPEEPLYCQLSTVQSVRGKKRQKDGKTGSSTAAIPIPKTSIREKNPPNSTTSSYSQYTTSSSSESYDYSTVFDSGNPSSSVPCFKVCCSSKPIDPYDGETDSSGHTSDESKPSSYVGPSFLEGFYSESLDKPLLRSESSETIGDEIDKWNREQPSSPDRKTGGQLIERVNSGEKKGGGIVGFLAWVFSPSPDRISDGKPLASSRSDGNIERSPSGGNPDEGLSTIEVFNKYSDWNL